VLQGTTSQLGEKSLEALFWKGTNLFVPLSRSKSSRLQPLRVGLEHFNGAHELFSEAAPFRTCLAPEVLLLIRNAFKTDSPNTAWRAIRPPMHRICSSCDLARLLDFRRTALTLQELNVRRALLIRFRSASHP
jgi:hypothetical protein